MAEEPQPPDMRSQLQKYTAALSTFASSSTTFRILISLPLSSPSSPPQTLYVLDSSFNPPTRAHLRIATSALLHDHGSPPKRLLLLLATQNADKAPKPAAFEQRLVMMELFAKDLLASLKEEENHPQPGSGTAIDIAITKHPYFTDKASSISSSNLYPSSTTQVHLTGFDTLIRILDPKYYPPSHTLTPLSPFLSNHRLRVTYRTDADWGGREVQDAYLRKLGDGEREEEGGKRDWAKRIELVEGRKSGEEVVSSTLVREAVKRGDESTLRRLVTDGVADWVLQEGLYRDN